MLALFNPEHDLCLANGDANYVPPASALRFARQGAYLMKILYGDDVTALAAEDVDGNSLNALSTPHHIPSPSGEGTEGRGFPLTAWGWDASLVRRLVKRGVPRELMPTDEQLATIRRLSHRRTALSAAEACGFKPMGEEAFRLSEVQTLLDRHRRVVLKAPWSGSGRGLRWVDNALSAHDADWLEKLLATQGSVMVEPRMEVVQDFALEYFVGGQVCARTGRLDAGSHQSPHNSSSPLGERAGESGFIGYSWFETQNGVYRENRLLSDDEILRRLSAYIPIEELISAKSAIETWLQAEVAPKYEGPLGIDMFVYKAAGGYALNPMVEINFRHTMGHVAVALRGQTTAATFSPNTL